MVCNVKKRYQNLARKLENYNLRNSKLFYERTQDHFSTESMLEVTAHRGVYVSVHTRADTRTYMPLLLLSPSKTQPLIGV